MAGRNPARSAARARTRKLLFGVMCALASVSCAPTRPAAEPVREHWVAGYVFGIWGRNELDLRDDCPTTGAARVRIGATWSTLIVSVVTFGMYTPREVIVHCRAVR